VPEKFEKGGGGEEREGGVARTTFLHLDKRKGKRVKTFQEGKKKKKRDNALWSAPGESMGKRGGRKAPK